MNMGASLYGRSVEAIWTFDLHNDRVLIPFGVGIGKVFRLGCAMINMFIEPEYTVYSHGAGQPALQVFTGINFQ